MPMSIYPHRKMASSLFIDAWHIKNLYILQVVEFMILISIFLQNLNPTTRSLRSLDFIYIILAGTSKCYAVSSVGDYTALDSLIIISSALTWSRKDRSYIALNTKTEK